MPLQRLASPEAAVAALAAAADHQVAHGTRPCCHKAGLSGRLTYRVFINMHDMALVELTVLVTIEVPRGRHQLCRFCVTSLACDGNHVCSQADEDHLTSIQHDSNAI